MDKLSVSSFQKPGTKTAQIRQQVTTISKYPSKKVESNLQKGLYSAENFGFTTQDFTSIENRVAFLLVPTAATEAEIKAKLDAAMKNGACIYKVLSSQPVLDENQKYAITQGLRTLDQFADTQVARYPAGSKDASGTSNEGQLVLDKEGNVQYRRTFFWPTPQEDVDIRDGNVYLSPAIKAELSGASVMTGQTV